MFLVIETNPNCEGAERVFSTTGAPRIVQKLHLEAPNGGLEEWVDVTGVGENGSISPAKAIQVEDSSDGIAWLVYGGDWGLKLKSSNSEWGLPFIVLDSSASSIMFG